MGNETAAVNQSAPAVPAVPANGTIPVADNQTVSIDASLPAVIAVPAEVAAGNIQTLDDGVNGAADAPLPPAEESPVDANAAEAVAAAPPATEAVANPGLAAANTGEATVPSSGGGQEAAGISLLVLVITASIHAIII